MNDIPLEHMSLSARKGIGSDLQPGRLLRTSRAMTSVAGFQRRTPYLASLPLRPIDLSLDLPLSFSDRYRSCA